jgi:putative membrane-bound dehydrogenase-like protein
LGISDASVAAEPRVLVEGYRLELVAKEPEIVTPIGLSFDNRGRLLVVENHTHQRRPNYSGPASDRVRMLSDSDSDGRLDRWSTFAEGFNPALNVLARPDGGVYVVTRAQVIFLRDTNGDDVADERKEILRLETTDNYPHNGLSGIAIDPDANELLIGLGENNGVAYKLIGADGTTIEGRGGRNGVYRCSLAGEKLRHIATGVWNPFSICVTSHGRVFAIDNDPDSSPPCRLLHVVPGGDYGYLFQYSRAGLHPLQAWDGQLPGTLPMVTGVGEAPTALLAHRGRLWVTSWGEHSIEAYRLVPRGASFSAAREIVVQGDADFRPTGMVIAPDGSFYFGDWVRRDYPVHGMGRIWRLTLPPADRDESFPPPTELELKAAELRANYRLTNQRTDFDATDPFLETAAVHGLATNSNREDLAKAPLTGTTSQRRILLSAKRLALQGAETDDALRRALEDESPDVRLVALRWITDERRTTLTADVERMLAEKIVGERYYLAALSAVEWLTAPPRLRNSRLTDGLLVRELRNSERTQVIHALALRLVGPNDAFLTSDQLRRYLRSDHGPLRLAAVRKLAQQTRPERFELLAEVARDAGFNDEMRAEAVMGLAAAAEQFRPLLEEFAAGQNKTLSREATRVLRLANLRPAAAETKPPVTDLDAWHQLTDQPGDAAAGRRLFFSFVGSRCAVCHQHGGQGGTIGPDLTGIGGRVSRERLLTSILRPSEEIAPRYQTWILVTEDGKTLVGQRLPEAGDNGTEEYADPAGVQFQLASAAIESRTPSSTSIMPEGLEKLISIDDLRDLLTFLSSSGESGQ